MKASRSPLFHAACCASSTSLTAFLTLASSAGASAADRATAAMPNHPRRPATAKRTRRAGLACKPFCIGGLLGADLWSRIAPLPCRLRLGRSHRLPALLWLGMHLRRHVVLVPVSHVAK